MKITQTTLPEVVLIEPKVYEDSRGFFMETYQKETFAKIYNAVEFIQDNHSRSIQGTLRGMHYQIQHAQGKLVRTVVGEIYDVAVDLRRSSPTFGQWVGCHLSAENKRQIWIPPGFAHGIFTLSAWAEIIYKTTDIYSPENERIILWDDPNIGIEWPFIPSVDILLSDKDQKGKKLSEAEVYP